MAKAAPTTKVAATGKAKKGPATPGSACSTSASASGKASAARGAAGKAREAAGKARETTGKARGAAGKASQAAVVAPGPASRPDLAGACSGATPDAPGLQVGPASGAAGSPKDLRTSAGAVASTLPDRALTCKLEDDVCGTLPSQLSLSSMSQDTLVFGPAADEVPPDSWLTCAQPLESPEENGACAETTPVDGLPGPDAEPAVQPVATKAPLTQTKVLWEGTVRESEQHMLVQR